MPDAPSPNHPDAPTLPPAEPANRTAVYDGSPPGDAATLPPAPPSGGRPTAGPVSVPGYEILSELGRGGMGVVYKARQVGLNRTVALKMILTGGHASAADLARFRTEAEAVARLQHPNVVQIYEVGEQGGLPYFSLEFCGGGSLAAQLDGTPWEPKRAAALMETLARAMRTAHARQIIHRDLKPANILLASGGVVSGESSESAPHHSPLATHQPKITDFGLAKQLDSGAGQTASGAILGTPSYMAPEQAGGDGNAVGPAADTYALGAILYELLTGRPPFVAVTPLDTVLQVVSDEPVPPTRLNSKTPRDLETICLKCLAKEPHRRYATAEALAEDLRRYQAGEPIAARAVGRVERGWRWCRRNPVVAGLLVVVVLVTVGGFVTTFALKQLAQDHARRADANAAQAETNAARAETNAAEAKANATEAKSNADRAEANAAEAGRRQREAEAQREEQRRAVYAAHMALASQAWESNHARPLLDLLEQHRPQIGEPDLRGFEWYYWKRQTHGESAVLRLVGERIYSQSKPSLSADAGRLALSAADGLRVWDVATGRVLLSRAEPKTGFRSQSDQSVALSRDGRRVAEWRASTEDDDGRVLRPNMLAVYDVDSGGELYTTPGAKVSTQVFYPESVGRRIGRARWAN